MNESADRRTWPPLHVEAMQDFEPLFVGRVRELTYVRDSLAEHGTAVIRGERGSGKTALLYKIRHDMQSQFPAGVAMIGGQQLFRRSIREELGRQIDVPPGAQALVILDDAHVLSPEQIDELDAFLKGHRAVRFVVATDSEASLPWTFLQGNRIILGGLSEEEYLQLLTRHVKAAGADQSIARELWKATNGKPLFAEVAGRTIRDRLLSWRELFESLKGFRHAGILDVSGQPLDSSTAMPRSLVIAVRNTNQHILERLRNDPQEFWALSPRKFEEIVAELLQGLGYEVGLTPLSGDGGFDMYAAKNDKVGRFLFLVECKRYVPPHKVGVQVVRSLYGVVHQKNANAGIIATTSFFTKGALEFEQERNHQVHLNDYLALQQWLKERR